MIQNKELNDIFFDNLGKKNTFEWIEWVIDENSNYKDIFFKQTKMTFSEYIKLDQSDFR